MQNYCFFARCASFSPCQPHCADFYVRSQPAYSLRSITSVMYSQSRASNACRYLAPYFRNFFHPYRRVFSPFIAPAAHTTRALQPRCQIGFTDSFHHTLS